MIPFSAALWTVSGCGRKEKYAEIQRNRGNKNKEGQYKKGHIHKKQTSKQKQSNKIRETYVFSD